MPTIRKLVWLCVMLHLSSLAATQTSYGASFLLLRWISLAALFAVSGFGWLKQRQRVEVPRSVDLRVVTYLLMWGGTVVLSIAPAFSGSRWLVHAAIVVSGLVFLPQLVHYSNASIYLLSLKILVGSSLLISYFRPAETTIFDSPDLFRGVFGNPNALGHMAAVGFVLFLHGFITEKGSRWASAQAMLAVLAALLVVRSGARSSTVALVTGLLVLIYFYRGRISKYLVAGMLVVFLSAAFNSSLIDRTRGFIFKGSKDNLADSVTDRVLATRQGNWDVHWQGFLMRPVVGWGFGMDSDTRIEEWTGQLSALGVTMRDPVNDVMYSLESGGVVGFLAYLIMLSGLGSTWLSKALRKRLLRCAKHPTQSALAAAYDVQCVYFALSIMLVSLFQWDNTSFAAGNFFSALLWTSMGVSLGLRASLRYLVARAEESIATISARTVEPTRIVQGRSLP